MPRDSVSSTIERVRRQLSSSIRMEINALAASVTTGDTVTMKYDLQVSLRSGSVLSIGTELMRVISVNVASKEVVVLRGWQDTNTETHAADAEVLINPRFTRFDIFDAMTQEIASWTPDIFRVEYFAYASESNDEVIQIPTDQADAIGVISVRSNWTDGISQSWPERTFVLQRGQANWPNVTNTGLQIRVTDNMGRLHAGNVNIEVGVPFDYELDDEAELLSDRGITGGLLELLELGVKYRLMQDAEVARSQRNAQDEPRRAEEVPPNVAVSLASQYYEMYQRKRGIERRRILASYPLRQW